MEKFQHDSNETRTLLLTWENVKCFLNREIVIEQWISSAKNYLTQVQADLIEDRRMVFIIESQIFLTYTQPTRQLCFVVGLIVVPLFLDFLYFMTH